MKKVLLLFILLLLTGCGKKKCDYTFNGNMTDDYSKDSYKCSSVTYVDNRNNFEIETTPTEDGKRFLMKMNYNGHLLWNSFSDIEFKNINIKKNRSINTIFVELYTDRKQANIYLMLLDMDGNLKFELASTSDYVVNGDKIIVREYLNVADSGEYLCKDYPMDAMAYREVTYNIYTFERLDSKEIPMKDVCS